MSSYLSNSGLRIVARVSRIKCLWRTRKDSHQQFRVIYIGYAKIRKSGNSFDTFVLKFELFCIANRKDQCLFWDARGLIEESSEDCLYCDWSNHLGDSWSTPGCSLAAGSVGRIYWFVLLIYITYNEMNGRNDDDYVFILLYRVCLWWVNERNYDQQ